MANIEQMKRAAKKIGYPVESVTYIEEYLTADAGHRRTIREGNFVTLDGTDSHGPNGIASYLWTQTSGFTITLSDPTDVQPVFITPDALLAGSLTFELTITDDADDQASDAVTFFVSQKDASASGHTLLTPQEAKYMIDTHPDLIVIDVREADEFCGEHGHIPGSVNYPWNSGVLQKKYQELPKDAEILVVCRSGNRSGQAASFLDSEGFTSVYDIGGMNSWDWETLNCTDVPPTLSFIINSDSGVSLNWSEYTGSYFESYRLLRDTVPNAEDPGDAYIWEESDVKITNYNDETPAGTSYYRLYVAKTDGERLYSDSIRVDIARPLAVSLSASETGGYTPLTVDFTITVSRGTGPYAYSWDFGDGSVSTDENPAHIYSSPGNYTATVTVTDAEGDTAEQSARITVTQENFAPMANAGSDQTVAEGVKVTLDASGSADPDGDALQYLWEQTEGTPVNLSDPSVARPTFDAPEAGRGVPGLPSDSCRRCWAEI